MTLYSGVAVLFDGADYADALTSAQLGLTFQSLADRLEEIESRLVEIGTYYQYDPATTSGLDFGFKAGQGAERQPGLGDAGGHGHPGR